METIKKWWDSLKPKQQKKAAIVGAFVAFVVFASILSNCSGS